MLSGSASLALHGALLVFLAVFSGEPAVHVPPRQIALTSIEMIGAAPSPPSTASPPSAVSPPSTTPPLPRPVARSTSPSVSPEARARRLQVPRSQPGAPAAASPLANLNVGYDDPASFAAPAATTVEGTHDGGRPGIGKGIERQLGDGVANMQIPQPSIVSLARPPRPRFDYRNLRLHGASKFAGRTIKVQLAVDIHGRVREVRLLQGVDRDLDRRTIALVHDFAFEPALDEDGAAIPGTSRWDIQVVEDDEEEPFLIRARKRF
jgi:hypothetical protein